MLRQRADGWGIGCWLSARSRCSPSRFSDCAGFRPTISIPFYNPQRWVGYLAAGCILYGIGDVLKCRLGAQKEIYKETIFNDLVFPVLMVLSCSAALQHIFRYLGFGLAVTLRTRCTSSLRRLCWWSRCHSASGRTWSIVRLALYFLAVKRKGTKQAPAPEAVSHAI